VETVRIAAKQYEIVIVLEGRAEVRKGLACAVSFEEGDALREERIVANGLQQWM
jgi:hypothetical protein